MQKLTRSLFATSALALTGVLAACGDDVTIPPDPVAVVVTPASASVRIGESVTLTAAVTGGASNIARTVNWTTSDASKATVDATGKVTGVAVGSATITATSTANADAKASALITVTGSGVRSVTVSPSNAIIKAGEFLQAAATVDADPGVARTVTWTSSATAVATVDNTGRVTGVADGTATITATSTVDNTVSGTLALTVRPIQPAQISIQRVTTGNTNTPVNFNNVFGQIDVTLNLDPGDQTVTKVEVLIDGTARCSQDLSEQQSEQLSLAAVFPEVDAVDIVCSINTADFNATTGAVTFPNGTHQLSARATIGGATPGNVATPSQTLTFNNANTYVATFGTFAASAVGTSGYSAGLGFRAGQLSVSVLPVIYNPGQTLAAGSTVTFGNAGCDASANGPRTRPLVAPAGGTGAWTATFPTSTAGGVNILTTVAAYEFNPNAAALAVIGNPPCGTAFPSGETVTINAVDNNGNTIFTGAAPATAQSIRLDNRAPGAPAFIANPNGRQNGWINATVGLTGQNGNASGTTPSATDNDWIQNGAPDAGVGGGTNTATSYLRFLRSAAATGGSVNDARAATASAAPDLPPPTIANNTLCAIVTARDELGNESGLPAANTACLNPPVASFQVTGSTHIRFGVDIAPPTVAYDVSSLADMARQNGASIGGEFVATLADTGAIGNSGMLAGSPLIANVIRREADGTSFTTAPQDCVVGTLTSSNTVCSQSTTGLAAPALPLVSTAIAALTVNGYYTYNSTALDAAGNSTPIAAARVIVFDNAPATATAPSVPAVITGAFSSASFLNDNLSIRDYYYTVGYNTAAAAYIAPSTFRIAAEPTVVDAFNAATLSNTNVGINTSINTFLGLQSTTAGNVPNAYAAGSIPLNGLNLFVRDQAQAAYSGPFSTVVAPTAPAAGVGVTNANPAWTFNTFVPATSNATICAGTLVAGCGATPTSTVLTAVATGTTATFNNPFSRVDFYAPLGTDLILIGSVPAAQATLVDNGAIRVWTYSLTVQAATLYPQLGGVSPAVVGPVNIFAFGVSPAGSVALVAQPVAQTINP